MRQYSSDGRVRFDISKKRPYNLTIPKDQMKLKPVPWKLELQFASIEPDFWMYPEAHEKWREEREQALTNFYKEKRV